MTTPIPYHFTKVSFSLSSSRLVSSSRIASAFAKSLAFRASARAFSKPSTCSSKSFASPLQTSSGSRLERGPSKLIQIAGRAAGGCPGWSPCGATASFFQCLSMFFKLQRCQETFHVVPCFRLELFARVTYTRQLPRKGRSLAAAEEPLSTGLSRPQSPF